MIGESKDCGIQGLLIKRIVESKGCWVHGCWMKDCWIQGCWIQGLLNSVCLSPRIAELKVVESIFVESKNRWIQDCWIQGLLNPKKFNLKFVKLKGCWGQGSLKVSVVDFFVVESKGCWIQVLLNQRVVECKCHKYEVIKSKVVESRFFDFMLHSRPAGSH